MPKYDITINGDSIVEVALGTIPQEMYDYWTEQGEDAALESCEDSDDNAGHGDEFALGEWYERNDQVHIKGPEVDSANIEVRDETHETIYEGEVNGLGQDSDEASYEIWDAPDGEYLLYGRRIFSGPYFTGVLETDNFDPEKLLVITKEVLDVVYVVGLRYFETDEKVIDIQNSEDVYQDFERMLIEFIDVDEVKDKQAN